MTTMEHGEITARLDLVMQAIRHVQAGVDGSNARLDKINGRVGATEQKVAVLEDRDTRKTAIVWSSVIGGGSVVLQQLWEKWRP